VARDPHIRLALADGVLDVELHRPARRNAITQGMYAALADAFDTASARDDVGAVLLRGQADCFTAGNDLDDFTTAGTRRERAGHRFLHAIAGCAVPIVAAVGGPAIGVGATMLLHCDFVLAAHRARFQLPFVPLGLCPEGGSSMLLPQRAGMRLAAELLYLGDPFDAATAVRAGIATAVVPEGALLEEARALAGRLARQPREALRATKALLQGTLGRTAVQAIEDEYPTFERLLASPEAQARIAARRAAKGAERDGAERDGAERDGAAGAYSTGRL
jgi:enoyl-CoA hydratase/carnithine racemase